MIPYLFEQEKKIKPILRKIDILPDDVFRIQKDVPWTCYLKSPMNKNNSHFSFIGLSPVIIFIQKKDHDKIVLEAQMRNNDLFESTDIDGDIFSCLKRFLKTCRMDSTSIDIPFLSGGIGYFSYDIVESIYDLKNYPNRSIDIPEAIWIFYDVIYIYNHQTGSAYLSAIHFDKNISNLISHKAFENLNYWEKHLIRNFDNLSLLFYSTEVINLNAMQSFLSKQEYYNHIKSIKYLISKGDIYQANLTYRSKIDFQGDTGNLFLYRTIKHPTLFSGFLNLSSFKILSFSPERLVSCSKKNIIVQPMKGTRPRGTSAKDDKILIEDLYNSEKDNAELLMIIDLMRNDIGKVSEYGSVQVKNLKTVETYESVHQMIGEICSKLDSDYDLIDLIQSVFPAGSITGCPKKRSVEILTDIEEFNRSIFMGNMGYISFHQSMDLNVMIRTLLYKDKYIYFQVGGGIVYDSDPEKEFMETLTKSSFLYNF